MHLVSMVKGGGNSLIMHCSSGKSRRLKRHMVCLKNSSKIISIWPEKKKGVTGSILLQLLERRLDNVVYRLGFASNRRQARQLVLHCHFTVNEKACKIFLHTWLRPGDIIGLREKSRKLSIIEENVSKIEHRGLPSWVEVDASNLQGKVLHSPAREEIQLPVQEQLIIELYSK